MSKIIDLFIIFLILELFFILITVIVNPILFYFLIVFYHIALTIHIFLSLFVSEITVGVVMLSIQWIIALRLYFTVFANFKLK